MDEITLRDQQLVSRPDVARLLGCSPATVRRLAEKGLLREVRFDAASHPRYPIADVIALASGGREASVG